MLLDFHFWIVRFYLVINPNIMKNSRIFFLHQFLSVLFHYSIFEPTTFIRSTTENRIFVSTVTVMISLSSIECLSNSFTKTIERKHLNVNIWMGVCLCFFNSMKFNKRNWASHVAPNEIIHEFESELCFQAIWPEKILKFTLKKYNIMNRRCANLPLKQHFLARIA